MKVLVQFGKDMWKGPEEKKKMIIEKVTSQNDEIEKLFERGFNMKHNKQRMQKLRHTVVGPKKKVQEPMVIQQIQKAWKDYI